MFGNVQKFPIFVAELKNFKWEKVIEKPEGVR
jgi:hypothetical protein